MDSGDMLTWILAQTRANAERIARTHCERQGHETYLPLYHDDILGRDRVLFPSYLFVRVGASVHHLRSTRGITRLVGFATSGAAEAISDEVIMALKGRESAEGRIRLEPALKPGDRVRFRSGPWNGQYALYQGQSSHDRVRILLEVLGAQRCVTVERRAITALAS